MSKINKIPLVPPEVKFQRRMDPQHHINFTYAHVNILMKRTTALKLIIFIN